MQDLLSTRSVEDLDDALEQKGCPDDLREEITSFIAALQEALRAPHH